MYRVSGFRSTVPESAGWHSHIPEPDEFDEPEDDEEGQVKPELWRRCPKHRPASRHDIGIGVSIWPCPDCGGGEGEPGLVRVPDGAVERMLDFEWATLSAVAPSLAEREALWRAEERPRMERRLRAAVGGEGQ